jgi:hypothetical protein
VITIAAPPRARASGCVISRWLTRPGSEKRVESAAKPIRLGSTRPARVMGEKRW